MTLVQERIQLDRTVLTLSSTLRHLSAPHKDATRFSLSSSWLRLSTHSFTVAMQHTRHVAITNRDKQNRCIGIHICTVQHGFEHISIQHPPLSTIWSRPPSSRSSSLNQSPALLEVNDRSVSMARCPVCRDRGQKHV